MQKMVRLTANQLVLAGIYLGAKRQNLNTEIKPFILGYKDDFYILNVSFTLIQFKSLINILINLISLRQKVLVINAFNFYNFGAILDLINVIYYKNKWIGGMLTNYRVVRQYFKSSKNKIIYKNILNMRYLPSFACFLNINYSKWALKEVLNLEIPTSSIINSNSINFKLIDYPILGNNMSSDALYLYLNVLRNSILKGKQKELLKVLSIF